MLLPLNQNLDIDYRKVRLSTDLLVSCLLSLCQCIPPWNTEECVYLTHPIFCSKLVSRILNLIQDSKIARITKDRDWSVFVYSWLKFNAACSASSTPHTHSSLLTQSRLRRHTKLFKYSRLHSWITAMGNSTVLRKFTSSDFVTVEVLDHHQPGIVVWGVLRIRAYTTITREVRSLYRRSL